MKLGSFLPCLSDHIKLALRDAVTKIHSYVANIENNLSKMAVIWEVICIMDGVIL